MSNQNLRNAMMFYLQSDLPVFPIQLTEINGKVEKKPVVEWMTYMSRLPSSEEVDAWFNQVQFNGIGMATGSLSGISVIDIDDPNIPHGFDSPVKVQTISGGYHLWFRHKTGVANRARINGRPIDVRGEGGFVVVPPSRVGNKSYSWVKRDFDRLPIFPVIVQDVVEKKERMRELPRAYEGSRNDTAIRVAGHIISNTDRMAWDTVAWPALVNWNETMCDPPLEESELKQVFQSCQQMEARNHPSVESQIRIHRGEKILSVYERRMEDFGGGLTTGFSFLDDYFTFIPQQMYLVSAPTHQNKTTLTLNMAARVASTGEEVLFCSLEQGVFIAPRIKSSLAGPIPSTLSLLESDFVLSSEQLIKTVQSLEPRPRLVVIDHLHFMKKETKQGITGGIDKMMIDLQTACKVLKVPFLVVSHVRKLQENRGPTLDDLRDSSSLSQIPRVVLLIHMRSDDGVIMGDGVVTIAKNSVTGKLGKIGINVADTGAIDFYQLTRGDGLPND